MSPGPVWPRSLPPLPFPRSWIRPQPPPHHQPWVGLRSWTLGLKKDLQALDPSGSSQETWRFSRSLAPLPLSVTCLGRTVGSQRPPVWKLTPRQRWQWRCSCRSSEPHPGSGRDGGKMQSLRPRADACPDPSQHLPDLGDIGRVYGDFSSLRPPWWATRGRHSRILLGSHLHAGSRHRVKGSLSFGDGEIMRECAGRHRMLELEGAFHITNSMSPFYRWKNWGSKSSRRRLTWWVARSQVSFATGRSLESKLQKGRRQSALFYPQRSRAQHWVGTPWISAGWRNQVLHFLAVWPWSSQLTSLSLSVLTCKMEQ